MIEATASFPRYRPAGLRAQTAAILRAWGMSAPCVDAAVDGLGYADLMGIDSHGIGMLPIYRKFLDEGRIDVAALPQVVRETPVATTIDARSALGFLPATQAMRAAIAKASAIGVGMAAVRRSNHFGAAGFYARMAAEAGLIGIATTNGHVEAVVPTRARIARFGTNPIAFAAPARRNRPFLFDMATSTVALGKLMTASYRGKPIPLGWALDPAGRPTSDPKIGYAARRATPLGATAELGSHKGYGLGAMVEILSAMVPGATWPPLRAARGHADGSGDLGHFMLALDPRQFREDGAFEDDLDAMIDTLRATEPVDPREPVLVAGDPEYAAHDERVRLGVPLPETLTSALRAIADAAGADWLLERMTG